MSREIPIIFNGDMVRAILADQKTQTRRPVKVQPHGVGSWVKHGDKWAFPNVNPYCSARCPFGQPGDLLWVRETWNWFDPVEIPVDRIGKRAPFTGCQGRRLIEWCAAYAADGEIYHPADGAKALWRPSIHMPRWASRILLRVTSVRVERVQDISERDAWAEGCEGCDDDVTGGSTGFGGFAELWDSIYGNWDANPWVWVIEFERVTDSKREAA